MNERRNHELASASLNAGFFKQQVGETSKEFHGTIIQARVQLKMVGCGPASFLPPKEGRWLPVTTMLLVFAWIRGLSALARLVLDIRRIYILIKRRRRQARTKKPPRKARTWRWFLSVYSWVSCRDCNTTTTIW